MKKSETSLYLGVIIMIVCAVLTIFNLTGSANTYLVDINYIYVLLFLIGGIALVVRYILKNK